MEYQYLTKTVTLPVSGLEAVIREADSFAEELITESNKGLAAALPDYWAYCTAKLGDKAPVTRDDVLALRTPDYKCLGIEIYRVTYGDTLILVNDDDPQESGYAVDLKELDFLAMTAGPDPTFKFTLPRTGHQIVYGYKTAAQDLEELELPGFQPTRMSFRAIRSVNGSTDIKLEAVKQWPGFDHKALRADMRKNQCGYDTRVRFRNKQGKAQVVDLFADPSFLLPGLMV